MLHARGMESITLTQYRSVYEHPIERMYQKLGFDLVQEPFALLSNEWHDEYVRRFDEIELHDDTIATLSRFKEKGASQLILSALPHSILIKSVRKRGINDYFDHIQGLPDNLGRSKIDSGRMMIEQLQIEPKEAVMIGDTGHDAETAQALGISCLLVARGAEAKERLESYGCQVFNDFGSILAYLGD